MAKCSGKTEVYSRVTGFFRPVQGWNRGKREEYKDRREFQIDFDALKKDETKPKK